MKISLAQKISAVLIGLAIIIVVVGGYVVFDSTRSTLISRARSQIESVSILKEYSISGFVSDATIEMDSFVSDEEIKIHLNQILTDEKNGENLNALKAHLINQTNEGDLFLGLSILDQDGQILVSSNPREEGMIRDQEPYFTPEQIETKIFGFTHDTVLKKTSLVITTPIRNSQNKFLGLLVGRLNTDKINRLLIDKSGLGNTGESFLISSSNVAITELRKEPGLALKKTIFLPQVEKCLAGTSNFDGTHDYHGDLVYGHWSWYPELQSCLVTKIDQAEILAPTNDLLKNFLPILLALLVFVGVIGVIIGKLLTKPLETLRRQANKIMEGDFDITLHKVSNDEIGLLSNTFFEMAGKLKDAYGLLETKVEAKTKELSQKVSELSELNKTLKDNDDAMLNLLEDSKELEKQLSDEKENVEAKVLERTEELKHEKTKLTASVSSLPLGFIMVDDSHHVSFLNQKALDLLSLTTDEISTTADIFNKFPKDSNMHKLHKAFHEGSKSVLVEGEVEYGTKILKISFVPISNTLPISETKAKAENLGSIMLFNDITEQKILERSKDEFFSIASHELRTPLTAIRGNASMIQDYFSDVLKNPELKSMIDDVHESSVRLIKIVNDFLNVSRLEQGKMTYDSRTFDIEKLLAEVVSEYNSTIKNTSLTIEHLPASPASPSITADQDKTREVITNLLGNALKFSSKGIIRITSEVKNGFVKVTVSDSGRGIPTAQQNLLFHKFQQAGSSLFTRDTVGGTGLGLYISRMMVEGMGGELKLEKSEEGKGSTFSFTLPVVKETKQKNILDKKQSKL